MVEYHMDGKELWWQAPPWIIGSSQTDEIVSSQRVLPVYLDSRYDVDDKAPVGAIEEFSSNIINHDG
jgi:hypothetical protein